MDRFFDWSESLQCVFQWLGFTVQVHNDVTKADLQKVLEEYKRHPGHADGDCFVFCILTHGLSEAVCSSDGFLTPIQEIISYFTAQQCPDLAGKPKLFFIQACEAAVPLEANVMNADQHLSQASGLSLSDKCLQEPEFLLSVATIPVYANFQKWKEGSIYIQSLCNHLKVLVPRCEDIASIIEIAIQDVDEIEEEPKFKEETEDVLFGKLDENCSMDFREKLLKIDARLGSKDVEVLKFLCGDFLSHKKLEKSSSASEIFDLLLAEELLTEEAPFFLAELLYTMKQNALLHFLDYSKEQVESCLATRRRVSPFRNLLYELSEDIISEDLRDMIFLLGQHLPKTELTSLSFMQHLEKQGLLSEDNLETLEKACKTVKPSLMKKIQNYKRQRSTQVVTPSVDNKAEILYQGQEEGLSHLGTMIVRGGFQMEPWENEQQNRNGDRATNDALPLVSTAVSGGSADITNPESTKEASVYRMDRKFRGHCVIVNNYTFSSLLPREGTHRDAESLECVFQWLGFAVQVYNEVTKAALKEILQEYKSHPDHADVDCFVFCILTHGDYGVVYSTDEAPTSIKEITSYFTAQQCPGLVGKPKLFFIQACQGSGLQPSVLIEADAVDPDKEFSVPQKWNLSNSIPDEADFLLGLATIPGYKSIRNRRRGSWYIQSLCNHLKDMVPRREDILSILTAVNNDVSQQEDLTGTMKQMPQPAFTLRRKLVFPVPQEALSLD
ncbi:PREDICTED: caspase-10 [Elephantulus edwardii]|uniref:caspase-10 n=1 Tax=Elephantulus edwardii TaxID=28737 RepID=UPI0003F080E5|nr:PREDICTED: caspase-10 [Elephantulus edwardii]